MTVPQVLLIIFSLISFIHLTCEGARLRIGRYLTKPLLMPVLALYYVTSAAHPNPFFVGAILCGWLGDVFLMIPDSHNSGRGFRLGLICFSAGHILYMLVFASSISRPFHLPVWGWA
ncbi:MAG: lysoplasmalogenase, partial [Deltaproteobacteria bacterium]|nr:lysoplasmalogenase [Deltaproteobacteria bacterium]